MAVRVLVPGDEEALGRFLAQHADTSMFLRSNLLAGGLVDCGETRQGTYAGVWDGEALCTVAAHFWNGMVIVLGSVELETAVARAVKWSGRDVSGFAGPWDQVVRARAALGPAQAPARKDSCEDLFALALTDLRIPEPLSRGECEVGPPRAEEISGLVQWRVEYGVETLGDMRGPEQEERCRRNILDYQARGAAWIARVAARPVSFSGFNAMVPDAVQIGGVYTPPELRGKGYGRCAVAGSLVAAQAQGVSRSILFTGKDNVAARRAYLALGYRIVGEYGLVLLAEH